MEFKSLPQVLDYFKDEKTGVEYFEKIRWGGNPVCPHCSSQNPYKTNRGYKCSNNECYKKFTVKVGTVFENSKIPFRIWFAAIFLANAHKKGISASNVSSGRSSMSQCPVSFKLISVTVVATSFICRPRIAALAFSPAMERTGILNFALAICAKSFAVSGNAAK